MRKARDEARQTRRREYLAEIVLKRALSSYVRRRRKGNHAVNVLKDFLRYGTLM
jgi:hypothetical protein